jgi:hypothetical protein
MEFMTREDLAERWKTSVRTIDRRRNLGLLPWVDLSHGRGNRPCVRFRTKDIEAYENGGLMYPTINNREGERGLRNVF